MRRPHRRASALLARSPWIGRLARWVWMVAGVALLGWFGPAPVLVHLPVPAPGLVGWLGGVGCIGAYVLYVPRLRGAALLRPLKAAVLVGVLALLYWGVTAASFHYAFGVDIWSEALWADVRAAWYEGRNLRWSAFGLLVADTFAWTAVVVLVWVRVSRVWVAVKVWGVWTMNWCLRALVFVTVGYTVLHVVGYGWWEIAEWLARSLAAFPAAADTVATAPPWAILAVLVVFGLVLLNFLIVVLETVSDVLCFVAKMLSIAFHGGIAHGDRHGDPDRPPKRIVGLVERFDRSQIRMGESYEAYFRHRLAKELASGITDDGWQEAPEPAQAPGAPSSETASEVARRRRWWPFGAAVAGPQAELVAASEAPPADTPEGASEPAEDSPETVATDGADGAEELPADELEPSDGNAVGTSGPVDTSARDAFLTESGEAQSAPGDAVPEAPAGTLAEGAEGATSEAPAPPDPEAEAQVLERARAVEATRQQSTEEVEAYRDDLDRKYEVEQERIEDERSAQFQYYEDGSDLVTSDLQGADDPFYPGVIDEYGAEVDEAWEAQEDAGASAYAGPFTSDDEGMPVDPDATAVAADEDRLDDPQTSLDLGLAESPYGVADDGDDGGPDTSVDEAGGGDVGRAATAASDSSEPSPEGPGEEEAAPIRDAPEALPAGRGGASGSGDDETGPPPAEAPVDGDDAPPRHVVPVQAERAAEAPDAEREAAGEDAFASSEAAGAMPGAVDESASEDGVDEPQPPHPGAVAPVADAGVEAAEGSPTGPGDGAAPVGSDERDDGAPGGVPGTPGGRESEARIGDGAPHAREPPMPSFAGRIEHDSVAGAGEYVATLPAFAGGDFRDDEGLASDDSDEVPGSFGPAVEHGGEAAPVAPGGVGADGGPGGAPSAAESEGPDGPPSGESGADAEPSTQRGRTDGQEVW